MLKTSTGPAVCNWPTTDPGSEIKTSVAVQSRWDWGMTGNSRADALIDRVPSPLWHIINLISNQIALFSISTEPCVSITHSIWTTCWLLNWSAQASHRICLGFFLCLCRSWQCEPDRGETQSMLTLDEQRGGYQRTQRLIIHKGPSHNVTQS